MPDETEIEISAARPDELDAIVRLVSGAFSLPVDAAREIFFSDPYLDLENKRVLRVGGEVASCLTIIDTSCWIGRGVARMAGMAGVATLPEMRGRGYAGRLLNATLENLRERKFAFAALVPAHPAYYRRFGWEFAALSQRYLTAPAHFPAYPEARRVRPAAAEDLPAMSKLYDAQSEGKTLRCLRDAKRWDYLYQFVKHRDVFIGIGGVEGYLLYEYRAAALPAAPTGANGAVIPPTLRLMEMVAGTPAARRGLVGHLAAQTQVACIETEMPIDSLRRNGLLHPLHGELPSLASVDITPAVMARIVDFDATVEALSANWSGLRGQLVLTLTDESLPDGGVSILLMGHGGVVTHLPLTIQDAAACHDRITGDVRIWSQVALGYLSGDDAIALNHLAATTDRACDLAAALFPRREPFLPLPDHF